MAEQLRDDDIDTGIRQVRRKHRPVVNVLPYVEDEILFDDALDVAVVEMFADRAAMFVPDFARRLVENLPATLPGHVAEVGILEIKRPENVIESAEGEEFAAIEGARSAAAVIARIQRFDVWIDDVAEAQMTIVPSGLRQARLFALLGWIAEKNLTGDREHQFIGEAIEQGREELRIDAHVAIEQDDDVILCRLKSGIGASAEAEVLGKR